MASLSQDLLIVAALPDEVGDLAQTYPCVITGCGKVNAAIHLLRHLATSRRPRLVLNLGSAGSPTLPHDSILEVSRFIQHDMDCSALGFARGQTPFDLHDAWAGPLDGVLRFGIQSGICATGDHFVSTKLDFDYDLVEMEAYALAKACRLMDLPFTSIKYVTDGADGTAHTDWRTNVKRAATAFHNLLQDKLEAVMAGLPVGS